MRMHGAGTAALAATFLFLSACSSDDDGGPGPSRWFYVANAEADTISVFSIDSATGALAALGTTPAGSAPTGMAKHPSMGILYVANADNWNRAGTVSAFAIDGSTGAITDIAGSPFAANTMALNVAITPSGQYLYATNQEAFQLTTFAVGGTGALAEAAFSPIAEYEAHAIVMHPSGRFFYTGAEDTEIKGRAIAADGSYTDTPGSPYASPMANNWLSITPDGRFLYSVDACCSGQLRGFAVNDATGALTELAWSPLLVAGNENMKTSVVTPSGDFLYVGFWSSDAVGAWRIDKATGALTAVAGMPFAAGDRPKSLDVDVEGRFLYSVNYGSANVSAFRIDAATGALTTVGTYAVGLGPKMGLTVP